MAEKIILKVIESHEEILDIIDRNVGTLVNFDWHADYPFHAEKTFDVDAYSSMIVENFPAWKYNHWSMILASKGYANQYLWFYPHDYAKDDIKLFNSQNGNCIVYNIKFNKKTKLPYKCITIDMDFFGCNIPVHWNPDDRQDLFIDILDCLTARSLMLVISKSKRYTNYDVEKFLEEINDILSNKTKVENLD